MRYETREKVIAAIALAGVIATIVGIVFEIKAVAQLMTVYPDIGRGMLAFAIGMGLFALVMII